MSASWVVGGRLMLAGLQRRWQSAVALVGGGRAPHARSRGPSAAPGGAARTPARRRRWRAARARSGCCPSRSAAPPARGPGLRAAPPPGAPVARRGAGGAPGARAGAGCGDGDAAFGMLGEALDGPAAGARAGRASNRARRRRARDTAPVTFSSEYTSAHRPTRCATTSGGTKMSGCTIAGPAGARRPWDHGTRPQPSMSADAWCRVRLQQD